MTAAEKLPDFLSVEDYLEGELVSNVRHEYYDGQVYAMAGGSRRHNQAASYVFRKVADKLDGGPCTTYMSDMKVRTAFMENDLFYYPDVVVTCDPEDTHRLYLTRPKFWLEVVSGDENKDRVEKNLIAQRIESMEEFMLIYPDPDEPQVAVVRRAENWQAEIVADGTIEIKSLGLTISVDDLYARLRKIPD